LETNCIVLAGGKGLRLGRDKALEIVGDSKLIQRAISRISFLNSEIIIVAATDKQSFIRFVDYPKLNLVVDTYPNKGPLGGILTGLSASHSIYNLVVACDMPFLNRDLLRYMIQAASGVDLVVPRIKSLVEPLHAVYSKNCVAPIKGLIDRGRLSVSQLFDLVKVRYIEAGEIERFDPEHLSFFNVNNEADLKRARELMKK
jgi:molybdopterin-guanine dinucleotide biosynthesis protein A